MLHNFQMPVIRASKAVGGEREGMQKKQHSRKRYYPRFFRVEERQVQALSDQMDKEKKIQ